MEINSTTVEQYHAAIQEAREAVAKEAATGWNLDELADAVNRVAKAEGAFAAVERTELMLSKGVETPAIVRQLTSMLTRGADDSWSGRTNDAKRARFDGFCRTVERIMDELA